MKVERYSVSGFKPQKQLRHLQDFVYPHMYHWKEFYEQYPKQARHLLVKRHKELLSLYKSNFNDFTEGVWVFIAGYKNNQSLNHLKYKVPCWTAELPDDTEVYSVNWDKKMKLNDWECKTFGCYVPKRSLGKLTDIERR